MGYTTSVSVRRLIRACELAAEPIGARGYQIWPQAVEDYRRTRSGGQGWDKRKAEDYTPSKAALWARDYRARKTAEATVDAALPGGDNSGGS